ncbi:MAG TPA: LapA family protein [bacterium]|nr:LapA family protein [bacterium]
MKVVKFFIGFLIICAFTMFATANLEKVQVNFLFNDQPLLGYASVEETHPDGSTTIQEVPRKIPLFILIYTTFGLGFLISWILSAGIVRKSRKQAKRLTKQNETIQRELNELRNLPVNDQSSSEIDQGPDTKALPIK